MANKKKTTKTNEKKQKCQSKKTIVVTSSFVLLVSVFIYFYIRFESSAPKKLKFEILAETEKELNEWMKVETDKIYSHLLPMNDENHKILKSGISFLNYLQLFDEKNSCFSSASMLAK